MDITLEKQQMYDHRSTEVYTQAFGLINDTRDNANKHVLIISLDSSREDIETALVSLNMDIKQAKQALLLAVECLKQHD